MPVFKYLPLSGLDYDICQLKSNFKSVSKERNSFISFSFDMFGSLGFCPWITSFTYGQFFWYLMEDLRLISSGKLRRCRRTSFLSFRTIGGKSGDMEMRSGCFFKFLAFANQSLRSSRSTKDIMIPASLYWLRRWQAFRAFFFSRIRYFEMLLG